MRPIRLVVAACSLALAALAAPVAAAAPSATAQPADCQFKDPDFGPVGTVKCGSSPAYVLWADNRFETFVLGADGVVYHEWQLSPGDKQGSGWYPLGSSNNVQYGVWKISNDPNAPVVMVQGGDGRDYCDSWVDNGWTNWTLC